MPERLGRRSSGSQKSRGSWPSSWSRSIDAGVAARAEAGQRAGQVDADVLDRAPLGRAALEAQLVQPGAGAHQDREGLRRDLDEHRAGIALGHVVEGRGRGR